MKSNFITIAIGSVAESDKLRQMLEKNKLAVKCEFLHSSLVTQKISVSEEDVMRAMRTIEIAENKRNIKHFKSENPIILIPVDFSDYSIKACEIGFGIAQKLGAEIMLLHTYFSAAVSFPKIYPDEEIVALLAQSGKDIDNLSAQLQEKIAKNELPNIPYSYIVKEGVPEDVIIEQAQKTHPVLVVMGTRGKNQKEYELIGSVTAEVIEHCSVPVLAIPESVLASKTPFGNVLFATNFDDKTLSSFDNMMKLLGEFKFKLFFVHFEAKKDAWNEIKLSGIKHYFSKNYPDIETDYSIISEESGNILVGFDKFVAKHQIGLIVLNTHKRNLFAQLFNPSIAKKMVFHAKVPILVFHT